MTTPIGDDSRVSAFDAFVRAAGVPLVSISNANNTVEGLTLQYTGTQTSAQESWVANAVTQFDWRSQVPLSVAQVKTALQGLASGQVNDAILTVAANGLIANPALADLLAANGTPIAVTVASPT